MIALEMAPNAKRIYVRVNRPVSFANLIPGAAYNKGAGKPYWSLPLSMPVCRRLREEFGEELEIGPELKAWAKAEVRKARDMKALAGASDAALRRVPEFAPRLAKAMESRTYQRVGARFVAEARANGAGCLVADQPGLGKTLEALGGVVESGIAGPYLVVTPKTSVESVWAREIPRWLNGQNVVTLPEGDIRQGRVTVKQRQRRDETLDALALSARLDRTWVIVHPEAIRTRVWWVCGVCGQETPRKAGKVELKCKNERKAIVFHDPELRKRDRVEYEYPQLFAREWGAVIVDESDRSLLRISGTPTQTRQGAEMLRLRADGLKLAMTGTPTRGRPHLLWGQLNWLDSKAFSSFWNWTQLFWEVGSNGFSHHVIGDLVREEELWASLDRYVLRRTKAEVAPDMPAKTYVGTPAVEGDEDSPIGVWLPMDGPQAKAYKEMLESSAADLADGSRIEAIGILAELMRLKQFAGASGRVTERLKTVPCGEAEDCPDGPEAHGHERMVKEYHPSLPSNKFEYLVQLLDELGYPDAPQTKVVVVSQFTEMLEMFARELPARMQALSVHPRTPLKAKMLPVLLTGAQTGKRREAAIAGMNEPVGTGAHLLLLQTKTGGVAITLDEADVMVFLDETWVPDDQEQAEDRIHRVSRPRPVFYHYLRSLDTVDLGIALTNAEREDSSKRLLDGRRGVEYARAVLRRTREIEDGVGPSSGGYAADRSGGLRNGDSDGAGKARSLERHSGGDQGTEPPARRSRSQKTANQSLAPTTVGPVQSSKTKKPKESKKMAKQLTDEQIKAYKDKATSPTQERFADWMIEKLEIDFPNGKAEAAFREAVRLATALRMIFQASPENQDAREEARSEREEAADAKKAAKKAPKAAKAADEDADEEPAKKSSPKKASARSGAAAPF